MQQIDLFGNDITGTDYFPVYDESQEEVEEGFSIVSSAQRRTMRESRFAYIFRDKSIEEIDKLHKTKSSYYFKRSNTLAGAQILSEWYSAMWAGETIALDKAYKAVDPRFVKIQTGEFYLVGKNGQKTAVTFKFNPDYLGSARRNTNPVPHFEFRSEGATQISETGYRSHFMHCIPYNAIKNFDDLVIQILREVLNVRATIIYEGEEFVCVKNPNKSSKQSKKKTSECPECGESASFKVDDECPSCGFCLEDSDEVIFEDFEQDEELNWEVLYVNHKQHTACTASY